MAAVYPGSVRNFSTHVDLTETVFALHMNDAQDEITAIQNVLGPTPQGGATGPATVGKRMLDLENGKSPVTHNHDTGSWVGLTIGNHDNTTRHAFGGALGTPPLPTALTVGSAGAVGTSPVPPHGDHDHPFPASAALASAVIPAGTIVMYGGTAAPAGWALCDGSSQLRGTTSADPYYNLYQAIGTGYGTADGTHFNLPDLRSRFPMGRATIAAAVVAGGARDAVLVSHAHPGSSVANSNADHNHYVEHQHGTSDSTHRHPIVGLFADQWGSVIGISIGGPNNSQQLVQTNAPNAGNFITFGQIGDVAHNHGNTGNMTARSTSDGASGAANHGHALTVAAQGVAATDANLPPYQTVNFLIKL